MLMQEIIQRKQSGAPLSDSEIAAVVDGLTCGDIPDYQTSALLMAIFFQGMSETECVCLTRAMMHSGELVDLSGIDGVKVDKHSTGGVGDKVSLILAPLVACLGVKVPMISGRGLGHTGGTLDKLESIPGFQVGLSKSRFCEVVEEVGCALIGQTPSMAPADKKIYALRDVTSTVRSLPLIVSSILSKKFVAGIDALVMDIKVGSGAFMRDKNAAEALAKLIIKVGNHFGKKTGCLLTDMSQPLGIAIGNALEVEEAIQALCGDGPEDLMQVTLELGSMMLYFAGICAEKEQALQMMQAALQDGRALQQFAKIIEAQEGDACVCDEVKRLPQAKKRQMLLAKRDGFIHEIDTEAIGMAALMLGAGRSRVEDNIDPAVGLRMQRRLGHAVKSGEPLVEVLYNNEAKLELVKERLHAAIKIKAEPIQPPPLIVETLGVTQ